MFVANARRWSFELIMVNTFVRKHFVHLISLLALLAFLTPGVSHDGARASRAHGQLDASGVSLFLMMLSAAIQCGFGAFRGVVARPKALLVCLAAVLRRAAGSAAGSLGQLCVPLLGRELGEPIQIGLDLVILMPVAATASIWVRDTKGDIELLVSLVVITMSIGTLIAPIVPLLHERPDGELDRHSARCSSSSSWSSACSCRSSSASRSTPVLRKRLSRVQPYFAFARQRRPVHGRLSSTSARPRRSCANLSLHQIACAILIVLAVNADQLPPRLGDRPRRRPATRGHQVTCEFSSGMRSNGTALVVGLASFPSTPLVTVPAAIYIIFQHLIAGIVKSRLVRRLGEGETAPAVAAAAATATAAATTSAGAARAA